MSGHFSKMTSTAWIDLGVNRLIKCWSDSLRCELAFLSRCLKTKMGCGAGIPGQLSPGREEVEGRRLSQDYGSGHTLLCNP